VYEITPDLQQIIRPESVGGTPANRMIHRESGQLIVGPYLIDGQRKVRVIPPKLMPGRLTGNARHLTDPANKVYFATMEEGLYEVDVKSLEITGLIKDGGGDKPGFTEQKNPASISSMLPGYHGKGLYSGQGRVIYANNGERGRDAESDPRTESGALAEWTGAGDWKLVPRNQFTEVTGPGGISGSDHPASGSGLARSGDRTRRCLASRRCQSRDSVRSIPLRWVSEADPPYRPQVRQGGGIPA
jgi:hypothetical protein